MKKIGIAVCLFLGACTSVNQRALLGELAESAAQRDTQVGYSSNDCFVVREQCVAGHYEEWLTSDGTPGCSCSR